MIPPQHAPDHIIMLWCQPAVIWRSALRVSAAPRACFPQSTGPAVQGLGLVFVAVYQRALKLLYVDALLQRVKADFAQQYAPKRYDYASFEELFRCLLLPLWALMHLHSNSYTAMPHDEEASPCDCWGMVT